MLETTKEETNNMSILRNKAFLLSLLIVAGLAVEFWAGSRYPALDQKAMMAGTAGLEPPRG